MLSILVKINREKKITMIERVKKINPIKNLNLIKKPSLIKKINKYSLNIGAIYQWVCKLKDDIKSETSDKTAEISEKSAAMMLHKLLDSIDGELEVFDKKLEDSKKLIANAEEERQKIVDKKDKYQGMIAQLEN